MTPRLLRRLLVVLAWPLLLGAAGLEETVMLVAKRDFRDPVYGSSVVIAKSLGADQHIGFIVNRPTRLTLGAAFPDHEPSRKVLDPVYLGGPFNPEFLSALVIRSHSPGERSLELLPDLFIAFDRKTVDRIIEDEADHARFLAGMVAWQAGELRSEIDGGLWHVLEADAALVLRKPTDGLWQELVQRAEKKDKGI